MTELSRLFEMKHGVACENEKACNIKLSIQRMVNDILKTQLFNEVTITIPRKEATTIMTELIETNRESLTEHGVSIELFFQRDEAIFTFSKE